MNGQQLLWIWLSGGLGAVIRVYASSALESRVDPNSWGIWLGGHLGTLVVNLVGCFLVGLASQLLSAELKVLVVGGFLGGLTTFGTLGALLYEHTLRGSWAVLALQIVGHLGLGVIAVGLGSGLAQAFKGG